MERRELLQGASALSTVLLSGCAAPGDGSERVPCSQTEDDSATSLEIDITNARDTTHALQVRFYEGESGRFHCQSRIDIAANPEPRSRVVEEFTVERKLYGVMVRLENDRTAWTYWEGDKDPSTLYVAIQDDALGIGGAELLD